MTHHLVRRKRFPIMGWCSALEAYLDTMVKDGWELVMMVGEDLFIFKRRDQNDG